MDPVIFSFQIGTFTLALRWYGVLVMFGTIMGALLMKLEVERRGGNGERVWDLLLWLVPAGLIGGRLWFVGNATLGGNNYYVDNPLQILNIPQGGLHIFGGLLVGAVVLVFYARRYKLDPWLYLDAIGPAVLVGQALARPANFINQELYGPPTTLPWGIPIEAHHRIAMYQDLTLYPVATTRFHPDFAYEMIWNLLIAALLLWVARRYANKLKPGAIFFAWLFFAGFGRFWLEFLRPDQPRIGEFWMSYTQVATLIMVTFGAIFFLARMGVFNISFIRWPERYQVADQK
jgi:phosphatidylglycerol---prolipoprotein diacylglyceryl transferase